MTVRQPRLTREYQTELPSTNCQVSPFCAPRRSNKLRAAQKNGSTAWRNLDGSFHISSVAVVPRNTDDEGHRTVCERIGFRASKKIAGDAVASEKVRGTNARSDPDPTVSKRVFTAMMGMWKIDIAQLEAARRG